MADSLAVSTKFYAVKDTQLALIFINRSGVRSIKEWNDALQYLSKDVPQGTVEATSKRLIQALFRSMAAGAIQENFAPRQK